MKVQMSDDQFREFMRDIWCRNDAGSIVPGSAAVVGTLPACVLGMDKVKRHRRWSDWHNAMDKMDFIKMTDPKQKLS